MKILFLSQIVPYPPHGGVLQRGFNLLREIHKYNEVHLLAFVHPDVLNTEELIMQSREKLSKYCREIEYFALWPKKSRYHKYSSLLLSLLSELPFSVIAHKSLLFERRVKEILNAQKIDLIHFDTIALAQFNDAAIQIPKVVTHHNIESQLMGRRAEKETNTLTKHYLYSQTNKIRSYEITECPRFDMNIVVSETDATQLRRIVTGVRTWVVPNGVDIEYFTPGYAVRHNPPAVIYAGGMNMFANKDAVMFFLKEIWPLIKSKIPEVRFHVIGQDPPNELAEMSRKDSNIEVAGYVTDMRTYAAKAAVYVVPLRVGGGTRLKVVDAMAMGKAIVSTSIGCEGIDVTPDENILIADEPSSFAEKTVALLQHPERCEKLGTAARSLAVTKYSWEIIGEKLQQAYKEVAENRFEFRRHHG